MAVFLADWAETWSTLIFVARKLTTSEFWLGFVQTLSFFKWVALGAALVTLLALWVKPTPESTSWADFVAAIRNARRGDAQHPAIALLGLIGLVALFVALVAIPAGGPLEQIPDVLRYQLSAEAGWLLRILSTFALLLFTGAVVAAGLASTDPASTYAQGTTLKTGVVVGLAAFVSLVLLILAGVLDGHWRPSPLAPVLVASALTVAAWLGKKARVAPSLGESVSPVRAPAAAVAPDGRRSTWVGALGGTILVAGGLGLVRAAFPAIVLQLDTQLGAVPWWIAVIGGVLTALVGGFVAQWIVELVERKAAASATGRAWYRLGPIVGAAAVTLVVAAWLAIKPDHAKYWGTTGVTAIGFGVLALVIGLLKWAARRYPPWEVTYSLGLGRRTPWLALLAVTWAVASVINTAGIYHDARVDSHLGPGTPRYSDLDSAFGAWLKVQTDSCAPVDGRPIPLVLVAAPGGGIRAAYWTATTLYRVISSNGECAARAVFAMSGVSGGSVGTASWVAARAMRRDPRDAVKRMSKDESLSSVAAGLLLRDLPQPYLGIATLWRNRAALLEDGWTQSAGVYGSQQAPLKWAELGQGKAKGSDWVPVLVLNGSSVTDGCRILVSNVGHLPAAEGSDCGAAAVKGPSGPVSGSIDPFPGLYKRSEEDPTQCGQYGTGMRAVTAALLSARFPIVSPSGALLRCVIDSTAHREIATYSVDGGYYENSGLLTLLQIWAATRPKVVHYNRNSVNREHPIEPWIVVIDNQYRGTAEAAQPRRPLELVAPFKALTNNRIVSQNTLEQRAALAVDRGHLIVIAPTVKPTIAAPLGWVLSATSRAELTSQLDSLLPAGGTPRDSSLAKLVRQVSRP
jgi:hypothetical protein